MKKAGNEQAFWKFPIYKIINFYERHRKVLFISFMLAGSFLLFIIFKNVFLSIFLSACLYIFAIEILENVKKRRSALLHSQLIHFINNMVIMLRAGKSVRQIFKRSAKWTENPLKDNLRELVNELALNISFDEAIDNFARRCGSSESKLLVCALKINNKIGGDLIFVLNSIADTLRESLKSKSKSETMTLQSKYSATIISFFPVIVLIILFIFMNDKMNAFLSSKFGNILIFAGGMLEMAGILVIRKVIRIGG
ncbi:MAG: type II secretion system F family protein [Actinomycetota bacterium]